MPAPVYEIEKEFDPSVIHSSSIQSLTQCGVAFKMRYIDGLPEERSGSSALFGIVMHRALEWWATDRTQSLLLLTEKAWAEIVEGTPLQGFLAEYQSLSKDAIRLEFKIREDWAAQGKESKAPRRTKVFTSSDVHHRTQALIGRFQAAMEKSSWRFTENDPLPALYDESLVLSKRYEARYKHLRPALHTEFKFDVSWRTFQLKGTVDVVEQQIGPTGVPIANLVTDYKSYVREPSPLKDYRQGVMYRIAVAIMAGAGELPEINAALPLYVGFDYLRWQDSWDTYNTPPRRYFDYGPADFDRLEKELGYFRHLTEQGIFLPAEKGFNPEFCAYPSRCCMKNTAAAGGQVRQVDVRL